MRKKCIVVPVLLIFMLFVACDLLNPDKIAGPKKESQPPVVSSVIPGYNTAPTSMWNFKWPFSGIYNACGPEYWKLVNGYGSGYHVGNNYHAVDLARVDGQTTGSKVLAPAYGTVIAAGWSDSWGWYVRMDHGNGWQSLMCHFNCDPRKFVNVSNVLLQGTVVGIAGATGWTGPERGLPAYPHIHFVIYRYGVSQPLTGISGYSNISLGSTYSSGNAYVVPPTGRLSCP